MAKTDRKQLEIAAEVIAKAQKFTMQAMDALIKAGVSREAAGNLVRAVADVHQAMLSPKPVASATRAHVGAKRAGKESWEKDAARQANRRDRLAKEKWVRQMEAMEETGEGWPTYRTYDDALGAVADLLLSRDLN